MLGLKLLTIISKLINLKLPYIEQYLPFFMFSKLPRYLWTLIVSISEIRNLTNAKASSIIWKRTIYPGQSIISITKLKCSVMQHTPFSLISRMTTSLLLGQSVRRHFIFMYEARKWLQDLIPLYWQVCILKNIRKTEKLLHKDEPAE